MASFSPFLIILSVFIAIFSSYISLVLIGKLADVAKGKRQIFVSAASVFMGLGIFTMHLIGMSAFHFYGNTDISYHALLLLASLGISILASFIAFQVLYNGKTTKVNIIFSGLMLGVGIILGHYIAMAAVQGDETSRLNWGFFILSIAVAFLFSTAAIKIFMNFKRLNKSLSRKAMSAVLLGMAISLMHYTAMNANLVDVQFSAAGPFWISEMSIMNTIFALSAALVVLAMLFAYADYRTIVVENRLIEENKESENRFRKLVELSPEPIVVHSQGKLIFVNEACLKMVGVENKELVLGKSILDFVPASFQPIVKERIHHMMQGGNAAPIEQQFIKPDGTLIDVEVTGAQMKFEGKPAIQLILRDITLEKKIRLELEASEQRYQSLFAYNPDGVFSMDPDGRMLNVNNAIMDLVGYTKEEFIGTTFHPIVAPPYLEKTQMHFEQALLGIPQNYELQCIRKNGEWVYLHITNLPIKIDDEIIGVYGIAKNITKEKEALRLMEENEEKYRSLFENNLDAVFEIALDGSFKNVNKRGEELTGFTQEELRDMPFTELIVEKTARVKEVFELAKQGNALQAEQKLVDKEKNELQVDLNVVPIRKQGQVDGMFSITRNVSEKKQLEKRMNDLAFTDQLTGLPNRHWFYENLSAIAAKARQYDRSLAVMLIDFDDFKGVNDLLGHQGGDLFLKKVSERIKSCLRPTDRLSRHGGDEFIIAFENVTKAYMTRLAKKIFQVMDRPVELFDHEMIVTISVGISMQEKCMNNEETLIREADFALYSAKEKGKNNYQFFTEDLNQKVSRKFEVENALRKAIEKNEFQLYYQSQVNLRTEKMVGLEALLRWNPSIGTVSPAEFIPIAEETGLILPIGEWVLEEACRQICEWEQDGKPKVKVSVNVSARQFRDSQFNRKVESILTAYQIDPAYLEIEITESVMMNIEESSKVIRGLRGLGIKIAIDDFGAGYSSLTVIKNIEIDTLKIDKSLIDDMLVNPRNLSILKAIIEVGKGLHTLVVVEGIEKEEQVELLKNFDVIGQGYYYSRPCPPLELENLWENVAD
ncbi:EAL domain-containing protein [Planococcus sp. NCCP-2050]|uniref:EAL domain-containing protein n=1 Tax=Planococcus sp. NCCP-2050 TaxID=2944679 RepID=UPI00203BE86C|nr:EAL domain-containing protein [Planococcus sp. NCCP-2050]GKW47154.1 hypothetical protein NCCP2050_28460 [Planococcus sp. NCCP-2050]